MGTIDRVLCVYNHVPAPGTIPSNEGSFDGGAAAGDRRMTTGVPASARPLSDDALIEFARERESNPDEHPAVSRALAALFVFAAFAALLLPSQRGVSAVAIVVSLLAYAVARQVQVEFTTFYLIPTEAIFVAMWFVLPARVLLLVVGAAMLLAELPGMIRSRRRVERTIVLNLASSWFSARPSFSVAAIHQPRWQDVAIYAGALGAQFLIDFAMTLILQRVAVGAVSVKAHLRPFLEAAGYDAMLAPLGLLAAFAVYRHSEAMLCSSPSC